MIIKELLEKFIIDNQKKKKKTRAWPKSEIDLK